MRLQIDWRNVLSHMHGKERSSSKSIYSIDVKVAADIVDLRSLELRTGYIFWKHRHVGFKVGYRSVIHTMRVGLIGSTVINSRVTEHTHIIFRL